MRPLIYFSMYVMFLSPHRIDLVFDSYGEGSVNDSEIRYHQDKAHIERNQIGDDTPLPINMDQFWPSNSNKVKL